jgi:enterochelin esterase-like enzyme
MTTSLQAAVSEDFGSWRSSMSRCLALHRDRDVKYTLLEVPGYGHEWKFWRLSLRDLLPRLFPQAR